MQTLQSKRPGGPLRGRPVPGLDGRWYDRYGESGSPDEVFATEFWLTKECGLRAYAGELRIAMGENIRKAAQSGQLSYFVDPTGITDSDKMRLSAARQLAREMGYYVGNFVFNPNAYTATAIIEKVGEAS